eukprot:13803662-Alexandrium_andersonii.AAC.1
MAGAGAPLSPGLFVVVQPPLELGLVDSYVGVLMKAVGAEESGETAYRICLPMCASEHLVGRSEVRTLPDSL